MSQLSVKEADLDAKIQSQNVLLVSLKGESAEDKVEIQSLEKNNLELNEINLNGNPSVKEACFEQREAKEKKRKYKVSWMNAN